VTRRVPRDWRPFDAWPADAQGAAVERLWEPGHEWELEQGRAKRSRAVREALRARKDAPAVVPVPELRRRLRAGETVERARWSNERDRTPLKSVRACETGTGWIVFAPARPRGAGDVSVSRLRCMSPSCRRCGPIVGRADLARLLPAITGRRWLYLVATLGDVELKRGKRAARARRAEAFTEWREKVEAQIGPLGSAAWRATLAELDANGPRDLERWDPFAEKSTRARSRLAEHVEARRWFEHARELEPWPSSWDVSEHPYHVADWAWRERLKRTIRTRVGSCAYVVTWEAQASGRPHLNVLIDADAFAEDLERDELVTVDEDGRTRTYPRNLRQWFKRAAMRAGFGRIFWCELCEPNGPALALYVAKLARELVCPSVKGQVPFNRPSGFRRYNTSQDLLESRLYPRSPALERCPEPGCDADPPRGGWTVRSLGRHLRVEHELTRSAAAALVRDEAPPREVGFATVLEASADGPTDDEVASVVATFGVDQPSAHDWHTIATDIRERRATPHRLPLDSFA
jgi:hypothetical protein